MKRLVILLLCFLCLTGCTPKETVLQGFSMDASYRIQTGDISLETEESVKQYMQNADRIFNAYREDSYLALLNHHKKLTVSKDDSLVQELYALIEKSLPYCNKQFDISIRPVTKLWDFKSENPVPPDVDMVAKNLQAVDSHNIILDGDFIVLENGAEIELGAVAKGYVCDKVAEMLNGYPSVIDIGGTVKAIGKDITAGIKSPDHDGILCSFSLPAGKAVATSGSYERNFTYGEVLYHHILDPNTGYPVDSPFVSVSVIADSALLCDILSTTYFATENSQLEDGVDVIFVTKDNRVFATEGIKNLKLFNTDYEVVNSLQE